MSWVRPAQNRLIIWVRGPRTPFIPSAPRTRDKLAPGGPDPIYTKFAFLTNLDFEIIQVRDTRTPFIPSARRTRDKLGPGAPDPNYQPVLGCLRPISTESVVHSGEFGPEPARPEYQKVLSAFTDQAHRTSGVNCGQERIIITIIISPFCSVRSSFSSLARPVSTPKHDRAQAIVPICDCQSSTSESAAV